MRYAFCNIRLLPTFCTGNIYLGATDLTLRTRLDGQWLGVVTQRNLGLCSLVPEGARFGFNNEGNSVVVDYTESGVEMTVEEMTRLCVEAFGKTWKSQLARELGVYNSTINRWCTGFTPISLKNARAIRDACRQRLLTKTSTAA